MTNSKWTFIVEIATNLFVSRVPLVFLVLFRSFLFLQVAEHKMHDYLLAKDQAEKIREKLRGGMKVIKDSERGIIYLFIIFQKDLSFSLFSYFLASFVISYWLVEFDSQLVMQEKEVQLMDEFERLTGRLARLKEEMYAHTESLEMLVDGIRKADESITASTTCQLVLESREILSERIAAVLPENVRSILVNYVCEVQPTVVEQKENTNTANNTNDSAFAASNDSSKNGGRITVLEATEATVGLGHAIRNFSWLLALI
jgi:hypothetical protein